MTSPWVGTNSGRRIDLLDPDPASISIEDIATGLSKVCRFNGQVKQFYSVAHHSLHVAKLVPPRLRHQALLHDATEAYICDIPTPLKLMLGTAYTDVERRLAAAIGERFGLDLVNLDPLVKQADRVMVVTEKYALQAVPLEWGPEYENTLRYPDFDPYFNNVEKLFLQMAKKYALDVALAPI